MIKPINITALNTSSDLEYRCERCEEKGIFHLTDIINTDSDGNPLILLNDYNCPNCGEKL